MTREEEIKARLKEYTVEYHCPVRGFKPADDDLRYLLARNEELQRRVDRFELALSGIKEESSKFATDESDMGYIFIGIYTCAESALDAASAPGSRRGRR